MALSNGTFKEKKKTVFYEDSKLQDVSERAC